MDQRRVAQAKCPGKLKSEHGYSNGTGIEVIQEILSLISLRDSVYHNVSDHVVINHVYQHHQTCILYKI